MGFWNIVEVGVVRKWSASKPLDEDVGSSGSCSCPGDPSPPLSGFADLCVRCVCVCVCWEQVGKSVRICWFGKQSASNPIKNQRWETQAIRSGAQSITELIMRILGW